MMSYLADVEKSTPVLVTEQEKAKKSSSKYNVHPKKILYLKDWVILGLELHRPSRLLPRKSAVPLLINTDTPDFLWAVKQGSPHSQFTGGEKDGHWQRAAGWRSPHLPISLSTPFRKSHLLVQMWLGTQRDRKVLHFTTETPRGFAKYLPSYLEGKQELVWASPLFQSCSGIRHLSWQLHLFLMTQERRGHSCCHPCWHILFL